MVWGLGLGLGPWAGRCCARRRGWRWVRVPCRALHGAVAQRAPCAPLRPPRPAQVAATGKTGRKVKRTEKDAFIKSILAGGWPRLAAWG